MASKRNGRLSFFSWLRLLFRQPPSDFYGRASIYLQGNTLEIEQFRRICTYSDQQLRLEVGKGLLTIYGDQLQIRTLSAHRLTLSGTILRTEFSPY